jgi:hypothetical protein
MQTFNILAPLPLCVFALNPNRLRARQLVAQNLLDDVVGGDAFGFGFEIRDEAMAQRGQRGGLDVLEADVEPGLCQRADFAGENERLCAKRAAAKADVLVRNRRGSGGVPCGSLAPKVGCFRGDWQAVNHWRLGSVHPLLVDARCFTRNSSHAGMPSPVLADSSKTTA